MHPGGHVRSSYTEGEIDLLAVYCGELDRCDLLPPGLVAGRREVALRWTPPRNAQRACINLADDYEFTGAVAQLGERVAGSHEVRGSSPLSSTSAAPKRRVEFGAHAFRERFGYYMERAAGGEDFLIRRHGRPFARLSPP